MQAKCHRFVFCQLKNVKCFVTISEIVTQAASPELLRAKTQNNQGDFDFLRLRMFLAPPDLVLPELEHISCVPVQKDKVNASFNAVPGQTSPFFVTSCHLVP